MNELLIDEKLDQVPLLVFANKQDLSNVIKASEIAETIGLIKLKDRTWQVQACSAINGTGVKVMLNVIQTAMRFKNIFGCSFIMPSLVYG